MYNLLWFFLMMHLLDLTTKIGGDYELLHDNTMIKKLSALIILVIIGIIVPTSVFANSVLDTLITTKLSPKVPGANQDVSVSINSYTMDLDGSEVIWYLNKQAFKQGVGLKTVTIHTGDFGERSVIDIVIMTHDGRKISKTIVIAPAEVDVLWEAQTYTPPFYKGKALPTYRSLVKVTAIPRFNSLTSDPSKYYYTWTYQRTLTVGKGLGKSTALVPMGFANTPVPVSVDVSFPGTDWSGEQSFSITPTVPKLAFYEQAPLLGTQFNNALQGSTRGSGNQFILRAVPYFFSTDDLKNGITQYTWTVRGQQQVPGPDQSSITLVKSGSGEEVFPVILQVQDTKRVLQRANAQSTISLPLEQQ